MKRIAGAALVTMMVLAGCASPSEGDDAASAEGAQSTAKKVGAYTAEVHIASAGGVAIDLLHAMNGWNCDAFASARYRETENDHAGHPVSIYHDGRSGYSFSTVLGRPSVTMDFTRDFGRWNPALDVRFSNTCTKTVEQRCTKYDDQNRPYEATCTETKSVELVWKCTATNLPEGEGQTTEQTCSPEPSSWSTAFLDWETVALQAMQSARITTKIRLNQLREVFDFDNCGSSTNGRDRFYLRITQGLGGHFGEDDFILNVKLDGFALPPARSASGLYSHAISFCRPPAADKKKLRIQLDGVEEDLIWDDIYTAAPEDSNVVMQTGTRREMRLVRQGSHGILAPKDSRVVVELFAEE